MSGISTTEITSSELEIKEIIIFFFPRFPSSYVYPFVHYFSPAAAMQLLIVAGSIVSPGKEFLSPFPSNLPSCSPLTIHHALD
jgi:hypothetical protein